MSLDPVGVVDASLIDWLTLYELFERFVSLTLGGGVTVAVTSTRLPTAPMTLAEKATCTQPPTGSAEIGTPLSS